MTAKTDTQPTGQSVPAPLADVALIDAPACAAAGSMSVSWWHQQVAEGNAPQPVIRAPRCTRWRVADVRAFWIAFASSGAAGTEGAEKVLTIAKQASDKARAKRTSKVEA